MPYDAPSLAELSLRAEGLQQSFSEFSDRYSPPSYVLLRERVSQLEPFYRKKVSAKSHFFFGLGVDSQRLNEISWITQLMASLPKAVSGAAEENQLSAIVLGALFYRRLAIKASYTNGSGAILSSVFMISDLVGNEKTSALYQCIEDVLGITAKNHLDYLTVASGLRAYHSYLHKEPSSKKPVYYCKDLSFSETLSSMIIRCESAANPMVETLRQLSGITTVSTMLRKTDAEIRQGLAIFYKALVTELKTKDSLSREQLISFLSTLKLSNRVKAAVDYLLPDNFSLTRASHIVFEASMKQRLERNSQYVLLGAYLLVLGLQQNKQPALKKTIDTTLNAHQAANAIDDKTTELALTALDSYLAMPDMSRDFDYSPWQGYDMLQHFGATQLQEVEKINQVLMW
jgi:hypothetical protein